MQHIKVKAKCVFERNENGRELHVEDNHQLLYWFFNHNRIYKCSSICVKWKHQVHLLHPSAVHSLHSALPHNVMKGATK